MTGECLDLTLSDWDGCLQSRQTDQRMLVLDCLELVQVGPDAAMLLLGGCGQGCHLPEGQRVAFDRVLW